MSARLTPKKRQTTLRKKPVTIPQHEALTPSGSLTTVKQHQRVMDVSDKDLPSIKKSRTPRNITDISHLTSHEELKSHFEHYLPQRIDAEHNFSQQIDAALNSEAPGFTEHRDALLGSPKSKKALILQVAAGGRINTSDMSSEDLKVLEGAKQEFSKMPVSEKNSLQRGLGISRAASSVVMERRSVAEKGVAHRSKNVKRKNLKIYKSMTEDTLAKNTIKEKTNIVKAHTTTTALGKTAQVGDKTKTYGGLFYNSNSLEPWSWSKSAALKNGEKGTMIDAYVRSDSVVFAPNIQPKESHKLDKVYVHSRDAADIYGIQRGNSMRRALYSKLPKASAV